MKLRDLQFEGHYEEVAGQTAERLQIVVPENELDARLLAWAILPRDETVGGDSARRDYIFHYHLGEHLGDGLFRLTIEARDASRVEHACEITAALSSTLNAPGKDQPTSFEPTWFISRRLHFKAREGFDAHAYPGHAYGRLEFGSAERLPQRRLFGATV